MNDLIRQTEIGGIFEEFFPQAVAGMKRLGEPVWLTQVRHYTEALRRIDTNLLRRTCERIWRRAKAHRDLPSAKDLRATAAKIADQDKYRDAERQRGERDRIAEAQGLEYRKGECPGMPPEIVAARQALAEGDMQSYIAMMRESVDSRIPEDERQRYHQRLDRLKERTDERRANPSRDAEHGQARRDGVASGLYVHAGDDSRPGDSDAELARSGFSVTPGAAGSPAPVRGEITNEQDEGRINQRGGAVEEPAQRGRTLRGDGGAGLPQAEAADGEHEREIAEVEK